MRKKLWISAVVMFITGIVMSVVGIGMQQTPRALAASDEAPGLCKALAQSGMNTISAIDVDVVHPHVVVEAGDKPGITCDVPHGVKWNKLSLRDGKLTIKERQALSLVWGEVFNSPSLMRSLNVWGSGTNLLVAGDAGGSIVITVTPGQELNTVAVASVGGDITIKDIRATDITVQGVNTDATLTGIKAGNVKIQTVAGNVIVEDADTDKLVSETVSGRTELEGSLGDTKVKTTSGNIEVHTKDITHFDASSISGNIYYVGPDLGFNITAIDGDVSYEDYLEQVGRGGTAQKGGTLSTLSGTVTVETP